MTKKRVLATVLATCLVCGVCPGASAVPDVDEMDPVSATIVFAAANAAVVVGTFIAAKIHVDKQSK